MFSGHAQVPAKHLLVMMLGVFTVLLITAPTMQANEDENGNGSDADHVSNGSDSDPDVNGEEEHSTTTPPEDDADRLPMTYTLSGFVYDVTEEKAAGESVHDWMGDGTSYESLSDWTIRLMENGSEFDTTTTDEHGEYSFTIPITADLDPAAFSVEQEVSGSDWQQEGIVVTFAGQSMPAPACARGGPRNEEADSSDGDGRPDSQTEGAEQPTGVQCDFYNVQTEQSETEENGNGEEVADTTGSGGGSTATRQSGNEERRAVQVQQTADEVNDEADEAAEGLEIIVDEDDVRGAVLGVETANDVDEHDRFADILADVVAIVGDIEIAHESGDITADEAVRLLEQLEAAVATLETL